MSDAGTKTTPQGEKLTAVGKVALLHIFPVKSIARVDADSLRCSDIGVYLPESNVYDR